MKIFKESQDYLNYQGLFNIDKWSQSIAFLANYLNHSNLTLSFSKLSNLLYLAERTFLQKYGMVLCGDIFVSSNNGLKLLNTSELLNQFQNNANVDWFKKELDKWITIQDNTISSKFSEDVGNKFLKLSDEDISILKSIVQDYGKYTDFELDNLINHSNQLCEEATYYEKFGLDDVIIPMEYLLEKIGYSKTVAHAISEQLKEQSDFSLAMKQCN